MDKNKDVSKSGQPTRENKSEEQKNSDQQSRSQILMDMHIESGEKINDYEV